LRGIHDDFFFVRHNEYWAKQSLIRIPAVRFATKMLVCGEDLGMIPQSVPEVLDFMKLLRLVVQRMPSKSTEEFAPLDKAPYMSVCTPGSHDMSVLKGWWKENRDITRRFWHDELHKDGEPPMDAEPWIVEEIIKMHLYSPSMLSIFQLQDLMATDESVVYQGNPDDERINVPAIMPYYWRYRMHINVEDLQENANFKNKLKSVIGESKRVL
jgi:4-alpha-glucanotransferase